MVVKEKFRCSGCNQEHECIFPSEVFSLLLLDYSKTAVEPEAHFFCNRDCLGIWLGKEEV